MLCFIEIWALQEVSSHFLVGNFPSKKGTWSPCQSPRRSREQELDDRTEVGRRGRLTSCPDMKSLAV